MAEDLQLITWVTSPKSDGGKFARSLKSPHLTEMSSPALSLRLI